jgi:hypothetical protein
MREDLLPNGMGAWDDTESAWQGGFTGTNRESWGGHSYTLPQIETEYYGAVFFR